MMNRIFSGYKYTTSVVINWGDVHELKKEARRQNRNFRKQRRIERCVVYPISGPMIGMGQLCILR